MTAASRHASLVVLGPTGSGKTPLGRALESAGLGGRRCHHLDFGALLRGAAAGERSLSRSYRHVAAEAVRTGRLLDDDEWVVAEALLDAWLEGREIAPDDLVVLNGVPRHVGQADDLASTFDVRTVVRLSASRTVLLARVRTNVGGDRGDRPDDTEDAVRRRVARFEERTLPLVAYYRERGARLETLPVSPRATGEDLRRALLSRVGEDPGPAAPR